MYSISGNSHSPIKEVLTDTGDEQNCNAVDDNTGDVCGEREGLRILDEFQKLYEERIDKVDQNSENELERASTKLQITTEWIKDLMEQNVMLVHTVEELEQAACSRAKLLEDKLKESSKRLSENITSTSNSEETLQELSSRIDKLEKEEHILQRRVEFLQSDIRGLLELIRRARQENSWSLDGIKFFEIEASDIPGPLNCACKEDQVESEKIRCLKIQIQKLQENEKATLAHQSELEEKLESLSTKLCIKDETLKKYVCKLQCLSNSLKKRSQAGNQIIVGPEHESDITLVADLVENVLFEKDLEAASLPQQLDDTKSMLPTQDATELQVKLDCKCKEVEDMERQMTRLQKEYIETREALTTEVAEKHDQVSALRKEVAALEEQSRCANMQAQFKDDIIKELRKGLKQATNKGTEHGSHCLNQQQDNIMSFLTSTKILMEKEKEALYDLKVELERIWDGVNARREETGDMAIVYKKLQTIETLLKNYKTQAIESQESVESLKDCIMSAEDQLGCLQNMFCDNCISCCLENTSPYKANISGHLLKCINDIDCVYTEKENSLRLIESLARKYTECPVSDVNTNRQMVTNPMSMQNFRMMEEFRVCTVEAQAATEDIREEMSYVVSAFDTRHEKYMELNNTISDMQERLSKARNGISEAIGRLEVQEEERKNLVDKVITGNSRLKDMKDDINRAKFELYRCLSSAQENVQAQTVHDLLTLVVEEVEEVITNLHAFQTQRCCITWVVTEINHQLNHVASVLKDLQTKTEEILVENDLCQKTFCAREKRLEKLEGEVDCAHSRMQDMLETFATAKEQDCGEPTDSCTEFGRMEKYEDCQEDCEQEIEKLKNTLASKDKLLMNKEEMIKIQQDSISMIQSELKDMHKKLQEKIDAQDQIISQYEKEKKELTKQNELQVQTIRHLQDAVVETKRCLDHMGHKALQKKEDTTTLHTLRILADETQEQYNECFAEAAGQDAMLELQRDAIEKLQKDIYRLDCDKRFLSSSLYSMYDSILNIIQQKAHPCLDDINGLRSKMDTLIRSKNCLEYKYMNMVQLWQETDRELRKLKKFLPKHKGQENDLLELKKEFEKVEELERMTPSENFVSLEDRNDEIKIMKCTEIVGCLHDEVELQREKAKNLCAQNACNESIMHEQLQLIEELEEKLRASEQLTDKYATEVTNSREMLFTLRARVHSLKEMLQKKSSYLAKLEADYEVLKNNNAISKAQNKILENKLKDEVCQLKIKLKEVQQELCIANNNYGRVTQDFDKTQEHLVNAAKREVGLQESLTTMEKDYCSKLIKLESENTELRVVIEKLREELKSIREELCSKDADLFQAQNTCKSYADALDEMQQHVNEQEEKIAKVEGANRCLLRRLEDRMEENRELLQREALLEQNNREYSNELQDMYRSLATLQRECQLKKKSLACISAELTETTTSRSELCDESRHMVTCIRTWMKEQEKLVETLAAKLKFKQRQLIQAAFEKRALLGVIKETRRINNVLLQRLKRCHIGRKIPLHASHGSASTFSHLYNKRCTTPNKVSRRISMCGNSWWFPTMEQLTKALRKNNQSWRKNLKKRQSVDIVWLEESRDCGYQSSTSK